MEVFVVDNTINDIDSYVSEILSGQFIDVVAGDSIFKGIQPREFDSLASIINDKFPDYQITYNFIRQSPKGQIEPNFIHTDDMMGDKTAILYLNKKENKLDGTTLYDNDNNPILIVNAKYNRLFVFDAEVPHARNIYENFGSGDESRLIQVIFMKKK